MISEKKRQDTFARWGEKKREKREWRIDGSVCIDFLVGIHVYLEKNIHEKRGQ